MEAIQFVKCLKQLDELASKTQKYLRNYVSNRHADRRKQGQCKIGWNTLSLSPRSFNKTFAIDFSETAI